MKERRLSRFGAMSASRSCCLSLKVIVPCNVECEDMVSFGGLVMGQMLLEYFYYFFSLMYQNVLNRGLKEVTYQ